jgi:putative transposase
MPLSYVQTPPSPSLFGRGELLRVPDCFARCDSCKPVISTRPSRVAAIINPMPTNRSDVGRQRLPHLAPLEVANQSTVIFLTMCVEKRRPLLARAEIVALLLGCWHQAGQWMVGRWVVMPDHLHLFCAPAIAPAMPVASWARFWRSQVTRRWPYPGEKPIWQRDFFDRRLRGGESYHQKWRYLWENPIKAGMVNRPEDWQHQGEMNVLAWHDPA